MVRMMTAAWHGVWEAGLFGRDCKGIDLAGFMPAVALVQRDVAEGKKTPVGAWTGGRVCRRAWVDWL